jgi:hypothetical protein
MTTATVVQVCSNTSSVKLAGRLKVGAHTGGVLGEGVGLGLALDVELGVEVALELGVGVDVALGVTLGVGVGLCVTLGVAVGVGGTQRHTAAAGRFRACVALSIHTFSGTVMYNGSVDSSY